MIEVYSQYAPDKATHVEFATLDEATYFADRMFNDRQDIISVTVINGEQIVIKRRWKGSDMTAATTLSHGTTVLWEDVDGTRSGKIGFNGVSRSRDGHLAYHIIGKDDEWYVLPVWALIPCPIFPGKKG